MRLTARRLLFALFPCLGFTSSSLLIAQGTNDLTIFGDRLHSDFLNWSWGTYEESQMREIFEGQSAMSFTPKNYSGLYLKKNRDPLLKRDYKSISIAIKISSDKPQSVRIGIGEPNTNRALSSLVIVQPGAWQKLSIPFDSMQFTIGEQFDKIYIQGGAMDSEGVFFVDAVALHKDSRAPGEIVPTPNPTPSPSPTSEPSPSGNSLGRLRPLNKREISLSLQEVLRLNQAPPMENFREQGSKTMTFYNAYSIFNDSSNLRGLERDITSTVASLNLTDFSSKLINCDALAVPMCREVLLKRIATHAWSRPLSDSENKLMKGISDQLAKIEASALDANLRLAVVRLFYDPRFLFRVQLGDGSGNLTLAEKLEAFTYSLWHKPPTLAQINRLKDFPDGSQFEKLAAELSHAPQLGQMLSEFVSQWLMISGLEEALIPSSPQWSRKQARLYMAELQDMIGSVLAGSGSLYALATTPNAQTENYGYGIFGSRAFLTASGKNGQPSMIFRGVRILRYALCQNLPPPPPNLVTVPPQDLDPADPSYDEKLVLQHSSQTACKGCHARIDPMGLALQTYDGLGNNRSHQVDFNALGIKPYASVSLGGQTDVISTNDPGMFAESMGQSSVFARCFARQAMRYVVGRELNKSETDFADSLALSHLRSGAESVDSIPDFFQALLAKSDLFSTQKS